MAPDELSQAARLLQAEFPEIPFSAIEAALKACDLDLPAARRRLYEQAEQLASSQQPGGVEVAQPGSPETDWSWEGLQKSMRDMGLESLGAQLSLLGRQVAQAVGDILPPELNPFGPDEEELEEEEMRAAARAAHEAAVEAETAAVAGGAERKLQSRRHGGGTATAAAPQQRGFSPEPEEEYWSDEVDDDKLD